MSAGYHRHAHGKEHAKPVRADSHALKLRGWVLVDSKANIARWRAGPCFLPAEAFRLEIQAFRASKVL